MATKERKPSDQLALAMKQASVVRMVALAQALQSQGRLKPTATGSHVARPKAKTLRVKASFA